METENLRFFRMLDNGWDSCNNVVPSLPKPYVAWPDFIQDNNEKEMRCNSARPRNPGLSSRTNPEAKLNTVQTSPVQYKSAKPEEAIHESKGIFGHREGYFSQKPPSNPLRVIPVGIDGSNRFHATSTNRTPPSGKTVTTNDTFIKVGEAGHHFIPDTTLLTTMPSFVMSVQDGTKLLASVLRSTNTNKNVKSLRSKRVVKALLEETLNNLPLTNARSACLSPIRTHSLGGYRSDGDNTQNLSEVNIDSFDLWVGGVRALRDSHVKLMLRQLRHVNKLNRALDRAHALCIDSESSM